MVTCNDAVRSSRVVSILGEPYVLPKYKDRCGKVRRFAAHVADTQAGIEVRGTEVEFGLVLHRSLWMRNEPQPHRFPAWSISEPLTGCRIAKGFTRQDALDTLAELVAYYGGEAAFMQVLEHGIQAALHAHSQAKAQADGKHDTTITA